MSIRDAISKALSKHIRTSLTPLCDNDYLAVLDDLIDELEAQRDAKLAETEEG